MSQAAERPALLDRPDYPRELADAEASRVRQRRLAASDRPLHGPALREAFGVALSGGGIRSATFCLGVFRALARIGLVRKIDFLSTVSGGGYFGSFLGGLFARPACPRCGASRGGQPADPNANGVCNRAVCVEETLKDLHSKPIEWLRENGRYMSPNGAGDTLMAGAVLLRNWVALIVVVSALVVTAFSTVALVLQRTLLGQYIAQPWTAAVFPVTLVVFGVVPLALGYWLTPLASDGGRLRTAVAAVAAAGILVWPVAPAAAPWMAHLRIAGVCAGLWWAAAVTAAVVRAWRPAAVRPEKTVLRPHTAGRRLREAWPTAQLLRNRMTRWLSLILWTAVGLGVMALADAAGRIVAAGPGGQTSRVLVSAAAAVAGALGAAKRLLPLVGTFGEARRLPLTPRLAIGLAAFLVCGSVVLGLATLTHALAARARVDTVWVYAAALTAAFGVARPFLNLSSHSTLYAQRLTRAYLGASSPERHERGTTISETLPGDGIAFSDYQPFVRGGPLHLLNVTLNETVSGTSQIEQRDRKGRPLAVGPCGVSVGRSDHARWSGHGGVPSLCPIPAAPQDAGAAVFPCGKGPFAGEDLPVGEWTSISGAAFSTGLGSRTSLALSLLLGLANVRLGHWWDSGVRPGDRVRRPADSTARRLAASVLSYAQPVYFHLLAELLARFPGTASRWWYLSDGGHFENTGAYELIRRRVGFILICDAGADPTYTFEDLANLVRKARTDFDAEVVFYDRHQLDLVLPETIRPYFGTQEDFRRLCVPPDAPPDGPARTCPHALLAGVFYADWTRERKVPDSVMLILKPVFSGDESPDVVDYRRSHPRFPQEPTADQFFDEAQWESYRRLGEHVASRVFGFPGDDDGTGFWRPIELTRPPAVEFPGTPRRLRTAAGG